MTKKILNPADTPVEAYDYWHEVWCDYQNEHYKEKFVEAGLTGCSFTERVPDAPGGRGFFSYAYAPDGTLYFIEEEGNSIIEYDSYALGIQMLGDENCDFGEQVKAGKVRFIKNPMDFAKMGPLQPIQREAFKVAIDAAEKKFDLELPKFW
ncbi:MAG: hypothetical protein HQ553_17435 [Chloroflexi bacterium]|nr:hypothetical protein [Chloroflexota bacterium]